MRQFMIVKQIFVDFSTNDKAQGCSMITNFEFQTNQKHFLNMPDSTRGRKRGSTVHKF